jgi:hypothetical protein
LVSRYIALAEQVGNSVGNTKYVALQMLEGCGKTMAFKAFTAAKDYAALRTAASGMVDEPIFCSPPQLHMRSEPPPDLPQLAAMPTNAWRAVPAHCKAALAYRNGSAFCNVTSARDAGAAAPAEALAPLKRARVDAGLSAYE